MQTMIPSYAAEFDKYAGNEFVHGGLNAQNVMRDDEYHLRG